MDSHLAYLSPAAGPVVPGLEAQEVTYAANQPEYNPLRTLRSSTEAGSVFSRWTLTAEQRSAVARGADIMLEVLTFNWRLQPVCMALIGETGEEFAREFHAQKLLITEPERFPTFSEFVSKEMQRSSIAQLLLMAIAQLSTKEGYSNLSPDEVYAKVRDIAESVRTPATAEDGTAQ